MEKVLDRFFGIHGKALGIWTQRAEILGSNIANADTPNYKAKDIDFNGILNNASERTAVQIAKTHKEHFGIDGNASSLAETKYRVPMQPSLDGNTVESQVEHGLFAENAVRHQVSLQFLSNRISGLIRTLREE